MKKLFVYGILKSTGRAFHKSECTKVKPATLTGYNMYSVGSFPAIVKDADINSDSIIHGEVHEYPYNIFSVFDRIEGYSESTHSGMYLREKVVTDDGEEVWMYLWNGDTDHLMEVPDGIWQV